MSVNRVCQNCGAHVTERYVRVFAVDEEEGVEVCEDPDCELVRDKDGGARDPHHGGAITASQQGNVENGSTSGPDWMEGSDA